MPLDSVAATARRPPADATRRSADVAAPSKRLGDRPWWPWVGRVVGWAFFALVAWLIVRHACTIDWSEVLQSIGTLPHRSIAIAIGLTAASYLLYSTFDLLGRRMVGHRLPTRTVMGVTFVCYAFNLNLGSLVGSIGFRYRLYSRLGLENDVIAKVIGFSLLTNWFGYLAIAGAAFCFGAIALPAGWKIDDGQLRVLGALLMGAALAYLGVCAFFGQRTWTIRGHAFETPTLRMAVLQLAVSVGNWALMGAVVWTVLQHRGAYLQVLAVLLVAAVAGVIAHVPAGLGVIEAVFIALLGHEIPQARLLGALLAYRAIYYLLPLLIASGFYAVTELRARRRHPGAAEAAG